MLKNQSRVILKIKITIRIQISKLNNLLSCLIKEIKIQDKFFISQEIMFQTILFSEIMKTRINFNKISIKIITIDNKIIIKTSNLGCIIIRIKRTKIEEIIKIKIFQDKINNSKI